MRALRLILICILLTNLAVAQQLITFTASVKYTKMGLDDQIDVTYYCEGDSVNNFEPAHFSNFEIVDGPRSAQSTRRTTENGRQIEKKSLMMFYVLKPLDTGSLIIEPATISLNNGSKVLSNSLTIKVLPGSVSNVLNGGNHKTLLESKRELEIAMFSSGFPFVVCAGPVYLFDSSSVGHVLSVINDSLRPLLRKKPASKEQGIYWVHDLPRLYVFVKDTTGIRDAIAAVYPKNDGGIYLTSITAPTFMMFTLEADFNNRYAYYEGFGNIKKLLSQHGADTVNDRRIVTSWSFNNTDSRDQFKKQVRKKYTIEEESDFSPKGVSNVTFKTITISAPVELEINALRKMATTLMNYSDANQGSFLKLEVARYTR